MEKMGRIFQWARLGAVDDMHSNWEEQQKNREAESGYARRFWGGGSGGESNGDEMADDDMRQTILGDVTHPTPVVISPPQQQSNTLQTVLMAASLAGVAGMGGYMLANRDNTPPPQPNVAEFDDESVNIGLGKIEDYLQANGK